MKLNLTALYNVHSGLKLAFGPSARVLRSWLMCALAALLFPVVSGAQTATGAQPLGSLTGGPDAINLGNLNIHYAFPVFSRPGRGMNFTYVLTYDNSIYQPLVSGSGTSWAPVTNFGWRGQTEVATGYISDKTTSQECFLSGTHDLGGMTTLTTYAYHDAFGGTHAISGIHKVIENDGAANCPADSDPPFDGTARDNSGYGVHADDTSIYATAKGGAQIHAPVNSTTGAATATDSNGNQIIVDASGNFADTLGTTALSISGSENAPPMSFIYHDTTGAPQSVVVNYAAMTVETFFQCANIGEYGPIAANLPTSISYPDGSSYVITYEQTPNGSGHVTGRVASVQLRTGGTISYAYRDGSNGVECSDGSTAGLKRTTPDGVTQYDRSGGGTQWTTTILDPAQNQTLISFQTAGPDPVNYYETKRQMYAGTSPLLRTVDTCYNGANPDCTATALTLPITQVSVYTTLENNERSQVNTFFDSVFGRPTETDEYDFAPNTITGALLRKTLTTYAFDASSPCVNHNVPPDRVCNVTVQDGGGTQVAMTQYGYDGTPLTTTSGVPHHVAASARGNLTTIQQWLNSPASMLTTTLTYDDTGNALSSTDPGGHQTTFSYADNFSDSASLNSLAHVTTVTLPTTHSPNTQAHTTSAKYEVNTGLVTDTYGQNQEHTSFHYDAMLRPTETDFPDSGKTLIQYDGVSEIWTWNYLDAANHTDFRQHIDAMGRMDRTANKNYEGSWDMQDTCFDSSGRPAFTSYMYQDANGWGDPSRCSGAGDALAYDALSRPATVTHSDGSAVTYSYAGRATQIQDEGNGSAKVTRVLQSDGLGRLTNVCEVSGTTLLGSGGAPASCGLDMTTATGFLTTYGYDTLNNMTHVDQGSLAVRTYGYDSLSRMTSEQFPEQNGNTTTYSYNNDGLLQTRVRPAPNNAGGNVTTTYSYDEMHRLRSTSYNDGVTEQAYYNYDETSTWGQATNNPVGRLTTAAANNSANTVGLAADIFPLVDAMGRVTYNGKCTPRTCGTGGYGLSYTYDQVGDVLTATNGVGVTFTNSYNAAARLTQMTSSLADANHPGTLLSNVQHGPFGLTSDTLGNNLNENYSYHPRGWLQNAAFGGSPAAQATGSVQYSGSEQLHNATTAGGTVNVGFNEPAPVQVQNFAGQQSTLAITINGISDSKKCDLLERGRCLEYVYNFGTITITVNGCSTHASWDETTTTTNASTLAANFSCSTVTASASGNVVNFKSIAYSAGANYAFTASTTWDNTDFVSPSFYPTPTSGNMSGGQDPTYNTVYNTGTATLCIGSNCSYTYPWNQNDNANTVASGLATAVQNDLARVANASPNGALITLTAISSGSSGNQALSVSSSYNTTYFGGPAATFSASGMANGSDGTADTGSATLTVAGITEPPYVWSAGDSASSIANSLAGELNGDPNRQANALSVTSCGINCSQINLQATTAGPDPTYSGGISHSDPSGFFPSSSFNASPTSATAMTGGVAGSPSVYSYALSFANDGSIIGGNDSANGNWTYGYDEFGRLVSSNKNSGAQTFSYDYDRLGNRWQQNAPQGGPAPQYTFDSGNHINNPDSNVVYDALGNVVNDGLGNTYTCDAENRLISVNGQSYVYDAFGRRVKTPHGEILYDLAGNAVTWFDAAGNWAYGEIYAGGRHLATYSGGVTNFLHADWLGSKRVTSSLSGAVSETCTSLPFGDGSSCGPTDWSYLNYTDDMHDSESNTEHTLFRQLSTTQGRWLSPDPAGMAAVDRTNPQSLNMYAYVLNNPLRAIDPLGLDCTLADGSIMFDFELGSDPETGCDYAGGSYSPPPSTQVNGGDADPVSFEPDPLDQAPIDSGPVPTLPNINGGGVVQIPLLNDPNSACNAALKSRKPECWRSSQS